MAPASRGCPRGGGGTLGNPEDSGREDWGTEQGRLGESPPGTLKNPISISDVVIGSCLLRSVSGWG